MSYDSNATLEIPKKEGYYLIKTKNHTVRAWHDPSTGNWLNEKLTEEIGFAAMVNGEKILSVS